MERNVKIKVSNLTKVYTVPGNADLVCIKEISFAISEHEFVCILGPSGCGKSTLLNIIAGLDSSTSGEVVLGNKRQARHNEASIAPTAFVFQHPRLLPWLTVKENIAFAMNCRKIPKTVQNQTIGQLVKLVHLDGFEKYYVHQLSGGMQQRASIARALAVNPDIILMDEPFSGLDEITARHLREELLSVWDKMQKTIVFVTHNAFEAAFLADRILILSDRPAILRADIDVPLSRPRSYNDVDVFNFSVKLVKTVV
jgi:NitT/TauT family transport system ATP-binding protein